MRIFIAEKPSQGRDIAKVLGCYKKGEGCISNDNTVVTWGFGHLLQPADPDAYDEKYKRWNLQDLPIIPEKWKLSPNPKSKAQLKIVKGWIGKATEVVIATDADREGELIARLILGYARYSGPIKRLWLSALDEQSIKRSLANLKDGSETEPLFWAGLGRQRADWMSGMSYTRASTILFGGQGNVCSVGRVQTPTLRLIVERDLEIENFKSKPFYTITANFKQNDSTLMNCDWVVADYAKGDDEGRCLDESIVNAVREKCLKQEALISKYGTTKKSSKAPLVFSLSELQKLANTKYGYDAKDVLNIAQALYEKHKATTYPRSDCGYLPLSQFEESSQILTNLSNINPTFRELNEYCNPEFKSRCWNDKKVNESSHHGIIPTNNNKVNISAMSEKELNIFKLIVRQFMAQFMGDYIYNETIVELICVEENFKTKGVIPIELGWKRAFDAPKEKEDGQDKIIPTLDKTIPLLNTSIKIHNKKTSPPQHYTDATLISAMKNCGRKVEDEANKKLFSEIQGIGTEATRADIIETLKNRSYIELKRKKLISTEKGRLLIKQLPDALSNIEITANWEKVLSDVAKGTVTYKSFIEGIQSTLNDNISILKNMAGKVDKFVENPCPKCGENLVRIKKKTSGFFWGCSGHRVSGCTVTMDDNRGKPRPRKEFPVSNIDCPQCKKHKLSQRISKNKKPYWGCSGFPACKAIFYDNNGTPKL